MHSKYYQRDIDGLKHTSKSGKGKVEESTVSNNIADKCEIGGKVSLNKQHTSHT